MTRYGMQGTISRTPPRLTAVRAESHERLLTTIQVVIDEDVAKESAVVGIKFKYRFPIPSTRAVRELGTHVDRRPTMSAHLRRFGAVVPFGDLGPVAVALARLDD